MPTDHSDTRLVIFDCDGVLVDSETISASLLIEELSRIGIEVSQDFIRERCLGRSFPVVAASIRADAERPLPEDFEERYRSRLLHRYETELRTTEGVEDVLERITCFNCLATSSSPPRVRRTLELTALDRFFGHRVFTASMVSRGKPAPDLFLHAAHVMGADPAETLVIEDSEPGLEAARAAGMKRALYAGGSHLAGNRPAVGPDVQVFDSWDDFPQELLRSPQGN